MKMKNKKPHAMTHEICMCGALCRGGVAVHAAYVQWFTIHFAEELYK
jgi:hypothetical protein